MGEIVAWSDVAIVIPTMEERSHLLCQLVAELQRECRGAQIAVHYHEPGSSARVDFPETIDLGITTDRRWILQVEDDVWLCPEFGDRCLGGIRYAEASDVSAVTFFSRSKRDVEMLSIGKTWRTQSPASFCMMQCVSLKTDALRGFSAWAPTWYNDPRNSHHQHAADLLLGAWLSRNKRKMLAHIPSLVQHRKVKSTLTGHRGARQSDTYSIAFGEAP